MSDIGLAEVVRALRAELETAIKEGAGETLRFDATGLELEFQVGVTKAADGKAGVRFWVLELGGGASYSSETIQTVRLSLQPVSQTGGRVRIAGGTDRSPLTHDSTEDDLA